MDEMNVVRNDFPILSRLVNGKHLIYFDNAATSQKPRQVLEKMDDFYRNHNANVHRGIHTLSQEATSLMDESRKKIAKFIGANNVKEVVFVRNATEAINLVRYTWAEENLQKGDVIVTSIAEHHSDFVPWQMLCKKKHVTLRVVEIDKNGFIDIKKLETLLDEKVKLVALSHVSNVLGVINEITNISKLVHQKSPKAKILLDGSQAVPHISVSVKDLNVDFYVFSGHKMLGPTGIGVLWGRQELLEKMPPFIFGGDMIGEVNLNDSTWNELPYKFEGGTPDIAGAIGLGAAVDYLSALSMEKVESIEHELTEYALEKLEKYQSEGWLILYGPKDATNRVGVISFNIQGIHAHDTAQVLDSFGVAVRSGHHCAAPLIKHLGVSATARVSFYFYNTKEEIDIFIEALTKVREVFR